MTIDDLLPDPRNPRSITSQAALGLQASLRAFGDLGMAWNRTTGEMVSGHQRVAALRAEANRRGVELRVKEHGDHCFVILPSGDGMEERQFYCRIVEMSRAEQNVANLAANNPGIQGEFTADVDALLAEAQESFPDLYDEMRLGEILEDVEDISNTDTTDEAKDAEPQVDRAAELAKTWGTKRGQVWEIPSKTVDGKSHRVMCGDCRDVADVNVLMAGQKVNVAFTSPPYASQRKYDEESGFKPIKPDEYVDWFDAVQVNVRSHLAVDGSWFVNIKEHCEDGQRHLYVKDLTIAHVRVWGWRFVDELVWKRHGVPGGWNNRFKNCWEPILHFSQASAIKCDPSAVSIQPAASTLSDKRRATYDHKPHAKAATGSGFVDGAFMSYSGAVLPGNVIECDAIENGIGHGAAFPVALPAFFIKAYSDPGDLIFDPFLGSGTTMVAAENESRQCVGMEISPKYVAVILQRATDMGLSPRLIDEAKP